MRFDALRTPVAEDDPAGPDLDEAFDNDYMNYVMSAAGRMPERFFTRTGEGRDRREVVFDGAGIDLNDETSQIEVLLRRTRDVRLLTLDARFHALVGDLAGFCEAVQGTAFVVTAFWDTFHPRPSGDDFTARRNAVEGLEDRARIIIPLQHAKITGVGRWRAVAY